MRAVELKDGTQFILFSKKGLVVRYPKKKFKKIFAKEKGKYYSLTYQYHELMALLKGFEMADKKIERKK